MNTHFDFLPGGTISIKYSDAFLRLGIPLSDGTFRGVEMPASQEDRIFMARRNRREARSEVIIAGNAHEAHRKPQFLSNFIVGNATRHAIAFAGLFASYHPFTHRRFPSSSFFVVFKIHIITAHSIQTGGGLRDAIGPVFLAIWRGNIGADRSSFSLDKRPTIPCSDSYRNEPRRLECQVLCVEAQSEVLGKMGSHGGAACGR
ncbi:hypothetical protein C7212DRAFT_366655 [Tuber magnatum]|uniref:Uncharacterized protein n=1 Tax=Tuber magnatum TaxID=42249 RepID=A0A317SD94_9PEZI|nr:hypothetical protein C7212DRAFT_366655 [Tuber magnatum]